MPKTLEELLNTAPDPLFYLVKPLLPLKGMLLLQGDTKIGKSMLALNMAYRLAEGMPILPKKDHWKPSNPLMVLYIEQELGYDRLRKRMQLIHEHFQGGIAPYTLYLKGKELGINLDTVDGHDKLEAEIATAKPRVLVIDPLIEFHNRDENDAKQMGGILKRLSGLAEKYSLGVIIVHHSNKGSEFISSSSHKTSRGSSVIPARADSVLTIDNPSTKEGHMRISFRLRDDENPGPLFLRFSADSNTFYVPEVDKPH